MFKKIQEVLKRESLFNQALNTLEIMFKKNKETFQLVTDALIEKREVTRDVYADDKEINRYEMEIRKKILQHISIQPEQDITFALILLGATRDTERSGDYCKNIYELSLRHPEVFPKDEYLALFKDTIKKILEMFDLIRTAFLESNEKDAEKVLSIYQLDITPKMRQVIENIMNDKEISHREAVIYVLLSRYLKRIGAHLANIASAVISPFQKIRYKKNGDHVDL